MIKRLIIGQIIEGNEQRNHSSCVHLACLAIFVASFNIGRTKHNFITVLFFILCCELTGVKCI